MVHCLQGLVTQSSVVAETCQIQLSGCVLVVVLDHLQLLESEGMKDIVRDLMKVLKLLPTCTNAAFVQDWWTYFLKCDADRRCGYIIDVLCYYYYL